MKQQSILVLAMLVLLFGSASTNSANTASFQGLGSLPGSHFWSDPLDVSADGSVVVGLSWRVWDTEAFRWENGVMTGLGGNQATDVSADGSVIVGRYSSWQALRWENGVMTVLGDLPGGPFYSYASDVSADGSVVVGASKSASGLEAFRWENGVMTGLGDLPGGAFESRAFYVSADGSVVVGNSESALGREAFRWENGVMTGLGDLPGGSFYSHAFDASADGSVIVGESYSESGQEAFRWENGVMTGLGDLPGGRFYSYAYRVSADGLVVVGRGRTIWEGIGLEAFRWENGVMTGLGYLPGGDYHSSSPELVSADGSIVVGYGSSYSGLEIFIWDKINGMRMLKKVLKEDYGLDLSGWILREPRAISADGLTIVGHGYSSNGSEGWIVELPEPAIEVEVDIDPNTLNLKSKGKWISCYIWLPEEYDVADVNSYSVFLENEIEAEWIWADEQEQVLMAKFSRSEVQEMLVGLETPTQIELLVTGELTDGTLFEGTDVITVIDKGKKK